ncbi:unnamed protein product, partial [Porites evermanni]
TSSFGCGRTLLDTAVSREEQLRANISDDAGEQDRDDLRRGLIFGRLSRVDNVCAKFRQPALTTTFLKKVRFQRTTGVTSVTPKLVFFVVAWTAVQQQRFANLVLFHNKLDIFHRLEILK